MKGRVEDRAKCIVVHTPDGEVRSVNFGEPEFGPGDYVRTGDTRDDFSGIYYEFTASSASRRIWHSPNSYQKAILTLDESGWLQQRRTLPS